MTNLKSCEYLLLDPNPKQVGRQVQLTNDVPNSLRGRVQSLQVKPAG